MCPHGIWHMSSRTDVRVPMLINMCPHDEMCSPHDLQEGMFHIVFMCPHAR